MREPENVRAAIEAAANNPKVATAVAAGATSMGIAEKMELLQGFIGTTSMVLGCLTAAVVLAIQSIKLIRVYRAWDPNKMDGDI